MWQPCRRPNPSRLRATLAQRRSGAAAPARRWWAAGVAAVLAAPHRRRAGLVALLATELTVMTRLLVA